LKVRESGMPEQDLWESFFDPSVILQQLDLNAHCCDVLDFGCGYGTFATAAAQLISGNVVALDIDDSMLAMAQIQAFQKHVNNIIFQQRDFINDGSGLDDESVDYAMLFNILHVENPVSLLMEAYRNLRNGGKLGIIHWNVDADTPRGPPLSIRPSAKQCLKWAKEAGFKSDNVSIKNLPPYHFGLVVSK